MLFHMPPKILKYFTFPEFEEQFNTCSCWCKSLASAFLLGSICVLVHSGINIPFVVLATTSHTVMLTVRQDENGRPHGFTLLFTIPRTVLLSSIQPEAETLDFSTTDFREIFRKSSHHGDTNQGSVVKHLVRCRGLSISKCFNPICAYFCNTV